MKLIESMDEGKSLTGSLYNNEAVTRIDSMTIVLTVLGSASSQYLNSPLPPPPPPSPLPPSPPPRARAPFKYRDTYRWLGGDYAAGVRRGRETVSRPPLPGVPDAAEVEAVLLWGGALVEGNKPPPRDIRRPMDGPCGKKSERWKREMGGKERHGREMEEGERWKRERHGRETQHVHGRVQP